MGNFFEYFIQFLFQIKKSNKISNICFSIVLFLLVVGTSTCCAKSLPVQFAGFSFRGNFCQIKKNYPFTYKIFKEQKGNRSVLDFELYEKIKNIPLKNIHLITRSYSSLENAPLCLACCMDNEMVVKDEYSGGYKIVIDLGAQILFFDFNTFTLVACYPLSIQLIHFSKSKPTDNMISNMIRDLLLSHRYKINLFDEFTHLLSNIECKKIYGEAMQVTDVILEKKALPFLPEKFQKDNNNLKIFVAQSFGKYLSKNLGVSVLPYTKGYTIGNKMSLRFNDAEVFQLEIPEPQFAVKLTLRGFKKVLVDKKSSGSSWVYGAFTHISITQPEGKKSYLDENIKNGVVKIVPAEQKGVDEWSVYQESLIGDEIGLFDKLTKSFSKKRKYRKVREVLAKCR